MTTDIIVAVLFVLLLSDSVNFVKSRTLSDGSNLSGHQDDDSIGSLFSGFNLTKRQVYDEGTGIDGFENDLEVGLDEDEGVEETEEEEEEEEIEDEEETEGETAEEEEEEVTEDQEEDEEVTEEEEDEGQEEKEEEAEEVEEEDDDNDVYENVDRGSYLGRRTGNSRRLSSLGGTKDNIDNSAGSSDENGESRSRDNFNRDSSPQNGGGFENLVNKVGVMVKSFSEGLGLGSRVDNGLDIESTDSIENINSRSRVDNVMGTNLNSGENFNTRAGSRAEGLGNMDAEMITNNGIGPGMTTINNNGQVMDSKMDNGLPKANTINQRPNNLMRTQKIN